MEFTTHYLAPKGQDNDYDAPSGLDDKMMHTQRTNAYPGLHPHRYTQLSRKIGELGLVGCAISISLVRRRRQ